jgi:hypothetical protein
MGKKRWWLGFQRLGNARAGKGDGNLFFGGEVMGK